MPARWSPRATRPASPAPTTSRYYAMNDDIRVIVAYLEAVQNPEAFMAACRMARSAGKPIVLMKLGASAEGRAAALAHTGALAGAMEAFDAVAGAAGVLRVRTVDDVVETVEYVLHAPLPRGAQARRHHVLGRAARPAARCRRAPMGSPLRRSPRPPRRGSPPCSASAPSWAIRSIPALPGSPTGKAMCNASRPCWTIPASTWCCCRPSCRARPAWTAAEANMRAVEAIAARARKPIVQFSMGSHGLSDYSRAFRPHLPHVPCLQEVDKTLRTVRALSDYSRRATQRPAGGAGGGIAAGPGAAREDSWRAPPSRNPARR